MFKIRLAYRNYVKVQWLGLCTSTAGDVGSIPGRGSQIPQAFWCGQKKKKKPKTRFLAETKLQMCFWFCVSSGGKFCVSSGGQGTSEATPRVLGSEVGPPRTSKSAPKVGKHWDRGAIQAPTQPWPQSWYKVLEYRLALITLCPRPAEVGTERTH